MPRHYRLDPTSRSLMAKAYSLGHERPSDLARQYGCSPSYVINTAKAWETEQALRKLKILEKQVRQQIVPPPLEMPEPKRSISLARVSIQHPKGD